MSILPTLDGNIAYGTGGAVDDVTVYTVAASSQILTVTRRYRLAPAAGSHLVSLVAKVTSGTGTVVGSAGEPFRFTVWEDVRPIANNGVT
jgi:hypothetical protein